MSDKPEANPEMETIATTDVAIKATDGFYVHLQIATMSGEMGDATVALTAGGLGLLVMLDGREGAALVDLKPLAQRMALALLEHASAEGTMTAPTDPKTGTAA